MKNFFLVLILLSSLMYSGCTEYQKLLKTTDMQYKYDKAIEYYKAGKYTRAYPLLEELYITYRGTEKGEKIAYYYANCEFFMKDYISAAHHYSQFHKNYPASQFSEECYFKSAYCTYLMSPPFSLDQAETYAAIKTFQMFSLEYPQSTLMDSVNNLLDELRYKLEYKDYKTALLYFDMSRYKAAKVAFEGFNGRYPNSKFKEEAHFLAFKAAYLLALNSVEDKKIERIEDAIKAYTTFADRFRESKYYKEATGMKEKISEVLQHSKEK